MDATQSVHPAARPGHRRRRPIGLLLAAAGLATVLAASGAMACAAVLMFLR